MNDSIVDCKKCGGDLCYKQEVTEDLSIYHCMGCGFITNTIFKKDNEFFKEQWEVLPELYKDLAFEDSEGLIWIPNTINIPNQCIIFVEGKDISEWGWCAVKMIPVLEEEKEKFKQPDGSYATHKSDISNMKMFNRTDYMEALDYLSLLDVE